MPAEANYRDHVARLVAALILLATLATPVLATPSAGSDGGSDFPVVAGLLVGPVLALVGRAVYRSARETARSWEQWNARTNRVPSSEIEPTDGHVRGWQVVGAVAVLLGVGWFLVAAVSLLI